MLPSSFVLVLLEFQQFSQAFSLRVPACHLQLQDHLETHPGTLKYFPLLSLCTNLINSTLDLPMGSIVALNSERNLGRWLNKGCLSCDQVQQFRAVISPLFCSSCRTQQSCRESSEHCSIFHRLMRGDCLVFRLELASAAPVE